MRFHDVSTLQGALARSILTASGPFLDSARP